jgi:hypothetical protein
VRHLSPEAQPWLQRRYTNRVWFIAIEIVTMTEIEGAIYATVMTEGIGITTDVLTAIVDLMIADLTTDASIMTGALVAPTGAGTAVAGSTGMAAGGFTKR